MGFFKKLFRRKKKKSKKNFNDGSFMPNDNVHHDHGNMIRKPAFQNNYNSFRSPEPHMHDSRYSSGKRKDIHNQGSHDSSYGSSFDSRGDSTFQQPQPRHKQPQPVDQFGHSPFQPDFSEFNNENNGNYANTQDMYGGRSPHHRNNSKKYGEEIHFEQQQHSNGFGNTFGHPNDFYNGNPTQKGYVGASPMSATSDFDLSTDAGDEEYNAFRRQDPKPMLGNFNNETVDDQDASFYPNSQGGGNSLYMSGSQSEFGSFKDGGNMNRSTYYVSDSEHEGGISPQSRASSNHPSPQVQSKFTFETDFSEAQIADSSKVVSPKENGPSPRTLAIQQAQNMRQKGNADESMYADSSDSEEESTKMETISPPSKTQKSEGIIENFGDFQNNTFDSNRSDDRHSRSVADASAPVSELLAQAKQRRNRKGGGSISSAPDNPRRNLPRPANSASAAAREKLQKRRMEKREWMKNNGVEDDSSENGEDNESWLHNEVSSALGPKGIQADLESLGEKSYRSRASRTSVGNRSHRSGSRRRSDASVGSRISRTSRNSRYSLKSTRSHLSHMSAESRSVANDLIRLEMQLAMVNKKGASNPVKEELQRKGVSISSNGSTGGSSAGGRSRSSSSRSQSNSTSRKIASRRPKTTVDAPPGKLGIILANRNDGKGTVVSGVRNTSVLFDQITPGDRIVAIDGEDVSRMSVTEITSIMARKADYDRRLTVLKSN